MAHIVFNIPSDKSELLNEINSNYTVKNVLIPGEIVEKLNEARILLRDEGSDFIIDNFDTYYSVLHHADALRPDVVFRAYKDLHKATDQLDNTIGFLLEDNDNLNDELRAKTVTILKMLLYIYTQFVLYLEEKKRKNQDDLMSGKGKKAKKNEDFVVDKTATLNLINNVIQREINLFWEPPVVEHDFVGMLAELCHSLLKNPAIKQEKEEKGAVFAIFGHLIKSYDYGKTFVTRLVQSIRVYEHVVHCVPEGVKLVVEQFKCPGLVHEFVKEATEWQVDETFQDNQGTRWCSLFLTELAVLLPKLMIPEVMYLNRYLAHESPPLRISILNVITEVILKVLTKHDLTDEEKESRDEFLDVLLEHIRDVSALVRAKVIQNLARLQKESAIPLSLQNEVLEHVIEHLYDKGANVRKAAIGCITTFVEHNPFAANLQLKKTEEDLALKREQLSAMEAAYRETLAGKIEEMEAEWVKISEDVKAAIQEKIEEESSDEEDEEDNEEAQQQIDKDQAAESIRSLLKDKKYYEAFKECRKLKNNIDEWKNMRKLNNADEVNLYHTILRTFFVATDKLTDELRTGAGMSAEDIQKIKTTENSVKYLEKTTAFLKIIDSAIKPMKKLLFTKTISDMHEAINFFVTTYQFKIDNASQGVLEMLKLIQYNEPERKEGVVEAFKTIYLTTDSKNMAEHTATILNRLISLIREITYDNFDDFQNIVSEWTSKGILDNSVIDKCWQYYTQREPVSNEDSRAAADLLRMAAMGRRTIVTKNINVVTSVAFSQKFKDDMLFLAISCRLLAVVGFEKIDIQSAQPPFKIAHTNPMFENLTNILVENFFGEAPYYLDALQAGIDCIFRVCSKPNEVCERIVKQIHEKMKDANKTTLLNVRFCQMLGYLAISVLGFLDNTVYRELKRRNFLREARKENGKNKNNRKSKSRKSIASNKTVNESSVNDSVMVGAEAEDTDAEFILNVLENYIVSNGGLLGRYASYLRNICERPDIYKSLMLQQAAVTALMRYMLVSSKFCRDNIRLLFTIFEKTTYPDIKCTVLMHCADLLTRFPNIVEPWSPRIYEKLKDPLVKVRKTAFFSLSNLILRDMIRAHAHISEMAACLIDENPEMSNMTKTFFGRLAQKENNLANVIPDIFSHLVKTDVSEENLRFIMKFLFDLVDNSKRIENLVDRFCCKYTPNEDLKLNRNITYCLSLISYNDKALKKLHEKFPMYKHHVHDTEIYSLFKQILTEASKQKPGKMDLKPIATDIENCIASVFEINEDGQPAMPPPVVKKPTKKSRTNSKNKRKASKKTSSSGSDSEEELMFKNRKARKGRNKRNRNSTTTASDSD